MYEETFGTDWTELDDREEAVRRAFALGVAARLGERHAGELDRISAEVDNSYDRSFVELAYHEGRDKASEHDATDDARDDEVWEDLVEGSTEFDPDLPGGPSPDEFEEPGPPGFLDHAEPDTKPDDSREAVERPKFLRRDEAEEPDRENRRSRRSRSGSDGDDSRREPTEEEREAFQELLESDSDSDDS